jgi:hypothetical protein
MRLSLIFIVECQNRMNRFGLLSEIQVEAPSSWKNRSFLTFDIDWVHDDILEDSIDLVESACVAVTWFVTHYTPLLTRIRLSRFFEIGAHPNFNRLINGVEQPGLSAADVLDEILSIVPEARSVRSHSVTQSGPIQALFLSRGITHDSNDVIPICAGIRTKPFKISSGLIKVPYCWADEHMWNENKRTNFNEVIDSVDTAVFDFHPIHVFLNTESVERYERTRHLHRNPNELIKYRYDGYGTRNRLIDLLELARKL